jgi:hypothetical protein
MYMNQILDVDELVSENKRQEGNRLNVFETILVRCHDLIKRHNKDRIREMKYTITPFVYGKPRYDVDVLRQYLIHHLKDNGLKVVELDRYHLYISWKETDINLSKYCQRKTLIDNRNNDMYMVEGISKPINPDRLRMMQFRQEKQKELQEERKKRFDFQKTRMPPLPQLDYQGYVKRY